jgi:hypothetical protein
MLKSLLVDSVETPARNPTPFMLKEFRAGFSCGLQLGPSKASLTLPVLVSFPPPTAFMLAPLLPVHRLAQQNSPGN